MPAKKKTTTTSSVEVQPEKPTVTFTAEQLLATRVILAPLVTEKTAKLSSEDVHAFKVADSSSRIEVAQAFKRLYGIQSKSVKIVRVHGKAKRYGRTAYRKMDWKKAYIAVAPGTKLNLVAGV